jgi:hypothetical protein
VGAVDDAGAGGLDSGLGGGVDLVAAEGVGVGVTPFLPTKLPGASSRSTEAAQPLTKQSWKKRRSTTAPAFRFAATARATAKRTVSCTDGHSLL